MNYNMISTTKCFNGGEIIIRFDNYINYWVAFSRYDTKDDVISRLEGLIEKMKEDTSDTDIKGL